jgi:hypothetical protein
VFLGRVKTPPEFLKGRLSISTKSLKEKKSGCGVARNGAGNRFKKGSPGCLGEELSFPTRDFLKEFCLDVIKGQALIVMDEEGKPKVPSFGGMVLRLRMDWTEWENYMIFRNDGVILYKLFLYPLKQQTREVVCWIKDCRKSG